MAPDEELTSKHVLFDLCAAFLQTITRLAALKAGLTPFIRQISHVNNEFSVYTLVSHGVSQGSVLGPIILTVCTLPYGNI